MKTAQRIKVIKTISDKLAVMEWADVDLILGQYGYSTYDPSWNNLSLQEYVIDVVKNSEEAPLLELHEYVTESNPPDLVTPENHLWAPGYLRLFLSHISKHKRMVTDVKSLLLSYGISSFVAHQDIKPSLEWQDQIELGLNTCDALVAFLHPGFEESNWTDQEVGFCMARRVPVLPLMFGLKPYGFIAKFQGDDCDKKDAEQTALTIVDMLLKHELTKSKMAEAAVLVFENSGSYATAKRNMSQLEKVTSWSPELLRRVQSAAETNSQINDSFGVKKRVTDLISNQTT
jgi:nucleoside 2-deoxyribosyltransferase